ncbi:hypothetical protein B0I35DRAFT_476086 [Stachybotrys elegans]|uniref:Uncharacterized protein n=1 Tax=Stachybotrys elegans TaxID=80388 RepID=A0A8K0SY06_9HYPO|nr:hypothetical protein B0I35DRAFT_476086 [Stachybotrys elegans]
MATSTSRSLQPRAARHPMNPAKDDPDLRRCGWGFYNPQCDCRSEMPESIYDWPEWEASLKRYECFKEHGEYSDKLTAEEKEDGFDEGCGKFLIHAGMFTIGDHENDYKLLEYAFEQFKESLGKLEDLGQLVGAIYEIICPESAKRDHLRHLVAAFAGEFLPFWMQAEPSAFHAYQHDMLAAADRRPSPLQIMDILVSFIQHPPKKGLNLFFPPPDWTPGLTASRWTFSRGPSKP